LPHFSKVFFTKVKGVRVKILALKELQGETSDIILTYINEVLNINQLQNKILGISADNTNSNFGGSSRSGKNNVFRKLEQTLGKDLIGINCAAHILNNCLQTACDCLPIDIECIVVKLYSYFYIYTVRVEEFKDFCIFVNVEYQKLLGHSKTRWLSLKPAIERIIKLFKTLKQWFSTGVPRSTSVPRNDHRCSANL